MNVKMFALLCTILLLNGCATMEGGDPRCTVDGYIKNAVVGGVAGALIGDNHRSAGRGAGAMVGVQAVTCATQSYRRVTTYGGGGQGGRPYYPPSNNNGGYRVNNDYYDAGQYTYRPRVYTKPYWDANGVHCNPILGKCKDGRGYVYNMQ